MRDVRYVVGAGCFAAEEISEEGEKRLQPSTNLIDKNEYVEYPKKRDLSLDCPRRG